MVEAEPKGWWVRRRNVVVAYAVATAVWVVLWRLPVLMADDRSLLSPLVFHAVGKPGKES